MDEMTQNTLSQLIQQLSFLMVLAYLLTRIPFFGDLLHRRFTLKNQIFLGLFFGVVSIYGTFSAVEVFGGLAHFRDLGPTIAGLLAGPVAGGMAGLLGGIHRYALGGLTVVPCTVATILAGLIGGGFYLWKRGRPVRVGEAVLVMVVITFLHVRVIAPAILGVSSEVTVILDAALVPMLLVNGAGIAVFFFMISNLRRERKTEADKQRMDSELRLAREIQMAMIPASALTEDPRYAVHAVLNPAREVGGDLYNVFALDGDRLVLAIGDVAGKGVPASLHMAMTQKLLKALARNDESPSSLLGRLNRELCEGNETMTFVTLFVAFCNVRTGEVVFGNGGHNPPYGILRDGVEPLRLDPGLALGIREQAVYTDQRIRLLPGEVLFLYTDGVTEAMNDREALFGDERLQACLCRLRDGTPESICRGILDDLAQFVGQREQSDDITMIALGLTDRRPAQGVGAETAQTGGST